jgi:hypothetical protein
MSTRLSERRPRTDDTTDLRRRLRLQHRELEAQMREASVALHRLRTTADVSDPEVQPALMSALRALDAAEREAIDVSNALARLAGGRLDR